MSKLFNHVLVTGGLGFIGSGIAMKLMELGYNVSVIDFADVTHKGPIRLVLKKLQDAAKENHVKFWFSNADVMNIGSTSTQNKLHMNEVDAVVHCAAYKSIAISIDNPIGFYSNNVQSTMSLLNVCAHKGIKRILFSSTAAVYDPCLWYCFEDPLKDPGECSVPTGYTTRFNDPYAGSKLIDEKLMKEYNRYVKDAEVIIFRYFNPIGSYKGLVEDFSDSMFGNGFRAVREHSTFHIFGDNYATQDGTCIRDYVDLRDIIEAHIKVLESPYPKDIKTGKISCIFNLGTGEHLSVLDCCKIIKKYVPEFKWDVVEPRQGDGVAGIALVNKIHKYFGWKSRYSVEQTVKESLGL